MHFGDIAGAKAKARQPLALLGEHAANPVGGRALAVGRHQLQRHVVEREQHSVGAVAGASPRRRAREQRLIGAAASPDVADQNDDVIEPGDHGNSPRVVLAARTFSTPIAIAAVRWEILSVFARITIVVEGAIENLIFAPRHFLFFPEQLLQVLHPFEIADHDAAGIAEDVRNQEDLVLALFQHQVGIRRGRTVGAFRQHAALAGFPRPWASITRSIAAGTSTSQGSVRICAGSNCSWLENPAMLPCSLSVPHQRRNIEAGLVIQRAGVIADRDHLEAELMQLQRGIGADIAKALDHSGGIVRG